MTRAQRRTRRRAIRRWMRDRVSHEWSHPKRRDRKALNHAREAAAAYAHQLAEDLRDYWTGEYHG